MSAHDQFLPLFLDAQHDLRAFIGAVVRDPVAREDVFQEVSLVLWKNFPKFDSSRSFGAWARGIAINKIMENRRELAKLPDSLTDEVLERVSAGFDRTEETVPRVEREKALHKCIESLPPKSGALFSERYDRGRAVDDLAGELGLSVDAIYQTLSRIRRLLRDCVVRRIASLER